MKRGLRLSFFFAFERRNMTSTLAVPTFSSGARDDLAAVDVYTRTEATVINKRANVLQAPNVSTINELRGGLSVMDVLPITQALASGNKASAIGMAVTKGSGLVSSLLSSVSSTIGPGAANALRALTPAVASAVATKLGGNSFGGMAGGFGLNNLGSVANYGGYANRILPSNMGDANSIMQAATALSATSFGGNGSAINNGSLANLVSGLVGQGSKVGVSGVFTQLRPVLTNQAQVTSVVQGCWSDVCSSSSVNTMKEFAVDPLAVQAIDKNALTDFSGLFKQPANCTAADYRSSFTDLTTTYTSIDPSWNTKEILNPDGEIVDRVSDMTVAMQGSQDFKKTLSIGALASTNADDKLYLVANAYEAPNPQKELLENFPLAVAVAPVNPTVQPTDARVVQQTAPAPESSKWALISKSAGRRVDDQGHSYMDVVEKFRNAAGTIKVKTSKIYNDVDNGDYTVTYIPAGSSS